MAFRARFNPRDRNEIPLWRTTAWPSGFNVITTSIGLSPIPERASIDYYMEFTESTIKPTRVQVRARRGDTSEEHAQFDAQIARWQGGVNPSIQGSVLGLAPGEDWVTRWRVSFDDGSTVDYVWPTQTIPAARTYADTAGLTPTRFVKPGGSDSADGTTYANAWATWQKMVSSAPMNAIVQVDDGYYESTADSGTGANERNSTITVIPRNKWIGDDGADLATGARVIVEPPARTSPTGSGHTNAGVWSLVSVTGPGLHGVAATSYSIWKWAGSPIMSATFVTATYRTNRGDDPSRLHHHLRNATAELATPGAFAEYLYTNLRYRFGCWVDSNGDIYVRVPDNSAASDDGGTGVDPNTLYLTFSSISQTGISLNNGSTSRVSGIGFIGFGRGVYAERPDATIDHCYFGACFQPVRLDNTDPHVVHCRILDSNMAADPPTFRDIDWNAIKDNGLAADGTELTNKICGASEGQIHVNASKRLYFAHNYVRGQFNGLGVIGQTNTTQRFSGWGTMIHANVFTLIPDDIAEPEQVAMCWKVWGNRMEKSIAALSTGPVNGGPIYFWGNEIWRNSASYIGRKLDGTTGASGKVFSKFSSESEPQATIYFVHNTAVCDVVNPDGTGPIFAGDSAGGTTSEGTKVHEKHWWYGNVIYTTYRIMDEVNEQNSTEWYDDYNYYVTRDDVSPSGIKVGGKHFNNSSATTDMGNYRSEKNQGLHSNLVGSTTYEVNGPASEAWMEAQIPGFASGDLALDAGSDLKAIVPVCPLTFRLGAGPFDAGAGAFD